MKTGDTVWKHSVRVKIDDFWFHVTLKFDGWPWETIGAPFLCYLKFFASFCSHWWIQTGVTVWKRPIWVQIDDFFYPCDLAIWRMSLKTNRAPLLCYFKLCVSFHSHWWIQTGVTVRKCLIWVEFDDFRAVWPWNLMYDLENNRAALLCYFKLCVSFHSHRWIQTGIIIRNCPIWI